MIKHPVGFPPCLKFMLPFIDVSGLEEWEPVTIDKPEDAAEMGDLDH